MPDFAAAPIEPIVEGRVTFPAGPGGVAVFDGKGIVSIFRLPATGGQGGYIFVFDVGLPGNAGAVPFGPSPPLAPDPDVRAMVTPLGTGAPPSSGITFIGVSYPPSAVTGVGSPAIAIVLQTSLGAFIDPVAGFHIVVWRGIGGGVVS